MNLLRELNTESGVTLIIVTHDPEVAAYADRIVHLKDGQISEIEITELSPSNQHVPAALQSITATNSNGGVLPLVIYAAGQFEIS